MTTRNTTSTPTENEIASFADYDEADRARLTTVVAGDFYPDSLEEAKELYVKFILTFRELAAKSSTSEDLLRKIVAQRSRDYVQLLRIFRRYVSPGTPVEMLKRKTRVEDTIRDFGPTFRPIEQVKAALGSRRVEDETLAALFWEYSDRGQKGYELTERFFAWFDVEFGKILNVIGPRRAGRDVYLSEVLEGFENRVAADFLIKDLSGTPLVVGFAHYDSDRGGGQESDRPGGNRDKITDIRRYAVENAIPLKILFLNDGPGLLLGRMWEAYAELEKHGEGDVIVATLMMLKQRFTESWIRSQ